MKVFSCWSQRNTARAWSSINYGNNGEVAPLPLLPRLLQHSIPTKMALIKDLMTPRRMAWNRRRVQCHHLFLRKRIPRTAGSNACLVRSSRLIGVKLCALIWWKASLLAYLSWVFFFLSHSLLALKENWTWSLRSMRFQDGNFPPPWSLPSFPW